MGLQLLPGTTTTYTAQPPVTQEYVTLEYSAHPLGLCSPGAREPTWLGYLAWILGLDTGRDACWNNEEVGSLSIQYYFLTEVHSRSVLSLVRGRGKSIIEEVYYARDIYIYQAIFKLLPRYFGTL